MAINSKGEKGCESPICLCVNRWLLISSAVVLEGEWSPPSVGVFDIQHLLDSIVFD